MTVKNNLKNVAPEPYFTAYIEVLNVGILHLRKWLRYGDDVSSEQIQDLINAIHNVPMLLYAYGLWYVHENIVEDRIAYDEKWGDGEKETSMLRLIESLEEHVNPEE